MHCAFCHGTEFSDKAGGLLGLPDLSKMLSFTAITKRLTLLTNGDPVPKVFLDYSCRHFSISSTSDALLAAATSCRRQSLLIGLPCAKSKSLLQSCRAQPPACSQPPTLMHLMAVPAHAQPAAWCMAAWPLARHLHCMCSPCLSITDPPVGYCRRIIPTRCIKSLGTRPSPQKSLP